MRAPRGMPRRPSPALWPGPLNNPKTISRFGGAALGAGVVANTLALAQPVYMLHVYDYVLTARSLTTLMWLTIITLFLLAVQVTLDHFRGDMLAAVADEVDDQVRARAFEGAWRLSRREGALDRSRFTSDLENVRGFLTGPGAGALMDLPWSPLFVVALFLLSPVLGLLCILFGGIVVVLSVLAEKSARPRIAKAAVEGKRAAGLAEDAFRAVDAASSMGFTRDLLKRWAGAVQAGNDAAFAARGDAALTQALVKGARLWLQVLLLGVAAWLVLIGQLSGGAMIAASIVGARALAPLDQAVGALRSITQARLGWLSLGDLVNQADKAEMDATFLPRPQGAIAVEDATLVVSDPAEPDKMRPLVRGVTMQIPAGAFVAIVGASGSGKTTLARMIAGGATPSAGVIRIDGANLATSRWKDAEGEFSPIGFLPQTAQLLGGTVAENIRRFGPLDDRGVVEAARSAGAHDLILRLPSGYETDIGDGGSRLSGGQRTLVALARALYRDPPVVVLDEPFNALDTAGQSSLWGALKTLRANKRTVVLVTHQPSHLRGFDLLAVMNGGRLERFGPVSEVLPKIAAPAGGPQPGGAG
jgi:ATP-binding cassette, subfamily C, bacterial EexD